ncbi:MAG: CapA family protein [Gemmatimonadota bacterium]|nr:MAG: CapA family protein [Gemmatimonadota bacterium]
MDRREFLIRTVEASLAVGASRLAAGPAPTRGADAAASPDPKREREPEAPSGLITVFLGGDVMTGRGIDQVLPHPGAPRLFESHVRAATRYVELAEAVSGPIPKPADYSYIWGDALEVFDRAAPDARVINLETSVTTSDEAWRGKGVHYRMHPANVPCIGAASIDCCVLANNHVLDWGTSGLEETLATLERAGIRTAGAGHDLGAAAAPAVLQLGAKGRVLVFGFGALSSGVPREWAATGSRPGVNLLPDLSRTTVRRIADEVRGAKREGDLVVASIHWGANWGYEVHRGAQEFARGLIDEAGVDVVHGHSSHHARGIEVYRDRPIVYGCGDLINDYEGIGGYETFRPDLALTYFPTLDPSDGRLVRFEISPFKIRRFRLNRASRADADWLRETLSREGERLGTWVEPGREDTLTLRWR